MTKPRPPLTPEARESLRTGQYNGVLHAAQKRKADNSANYATNFKHGQMASDLERSAEAAGESREELRGHFALLDRTLLTLCGYFPRIAGALSGVMSGSIFDTPLTPGPTPPRGQGESTSENSEDGAFKDSVTGNGLPSPPWGRGAGGEGDRRRGADQDIRLPLHTDAASPRAPKLVRALAILLWRPFRLYRNQEGWERLAICYLLQRIIHWRREHGELTVERVEKLHWDLYAILENYYWHINPRLKKIEKRFWKVWRVYRGLVGVVGAVLASRDSVFGFRGSGEKARDSGPGAGDSELPIDDCRLPIEEGRGLTSAAAEDQPPFSDSELPIADSRLPTQEPHHDNRQSAIENRQCLIQFRGKPHYEQFHPTWLERLDDLSPEDIANPFQSPSHSRNAKGKRSQPVAIKDPKEWQEQPPKPRLPEGELSEVPASEFFRTPSERELRRLLRRGELTVPGSFEDFLALVEEALGARASRPQEAQKPAAGETPALPGYLHALAESLWNRMNVFSPRMAELRELLEATLVWQPSRFLRLWLKLLPVEHAYHAVSFFERTHGPDRVDMAWGDDETTPPWRAGKPRPAERPRSEAEGRKVHTGELQHALRNWFHAVWQALVPGLRGTHKVTVALYDWAVSRFGIREEFLQWRPNLSLAQLDTRRGRAEWAVRVVTVTGKILVKLRDGRIFEPEK